MIGLDADLTLIFDMDPDISAARAGERGGIEDRFERKGLEFQHILRQAFLDIAAAEPERCVIVDADGTPEAVACRVWGQVAGRLF